MGIFRLLLAISVLGAHIHGKGIFSFRLLDANLAMECFYMISGFYMALVLNQKYPPGQYRLFITQRYLRLWPTYMAIFLLTLGIEIGFYLGEGKALGNFGNWLADYQNFHPLTWAALLGSNLSLVGIDWVSHLPPCQGSYNIVAPAWSLGVELTFYLLAPLLVRQAYFVQTVILLLSVLARFLGYALGHNASYFHVGFFPFELAFFLTGSLCYQHYVRYPEVMQRCAPALQLWGRWLFYILVIIYTRLPYPNEKRFYWMAPLVIILLPLLFYATKDSVWDRFLGELSYPFYLAHPIFILLFENTIDPYIAMNHRGGMYVIATLIFSVFFYWYFESPLERWRHRLAADKVRLLST